MSTDCVEKGDSVLEWGYLLPGCGLTRLLGPSLYLWTSFWNAGAKSRTALKKIKIAGHKDLWDIINEERARRTDPKCRIVYLEVNIAQTFVFQLEMALERLRRSCCGSVGKEKEIVAIIPTRMIVPTEAQQCQQHCKGPLPHSESSSGCPGPESWENGTERLQGRKGNKNPSG